MGRTGEMVLGIIGGVFGIIAAVFMITVGGVGSAFGADASFILHHGFGMLILGLIGVVGGAIVNINNKISGFMMLGSGFLGLIVGGGFWILSGVLLIVGGILALRQKEDDT